MSGMQIEMRTVEQQVPAWINIGGHRAPWGLVMDVLVRSGAFENQPTERFQNRFAAELDEFTASEDERVVMHAIIESEENMSQVKEYIPEQFLPKGIH